MNGCGGEYNTSFGFYNKKSLAKLNKAYENAQKNAEKEKVMKILAVSFLKALNSMNETQDVENRQPSYHRIEILVDEFIPRVDKFKLQLDELSQKIEEINSVFDANFKEPNLNPEVNTPLPAASAIVVTQVEPVAFREMNIQVINNPNDQGFYCKFQEVMQIWFNAMMDITAEVIEITILSPNDFFSQRLGLGRTLGGVATAVSFIGLGCFTLPSAITWVGINRLLQA